MRSILTENTLLKKMRRIAHIDMDAFFASIELLRYPELRDQAVVVGGRSDGSAQFSRLSDYVGRGVVTTSTYEARALGVFSGMGLMKSAQLAPHAILLPANFEAYRHYSKLFKEAVVSIAPNIEDRGIDEVYVDLSDIPEDTESLALRIKEAVFKKTELTCSIGVTPNKLLSKISSELDKPNGLTILTMEDIPTRIWPLSVKKINGIGPKSTEKLAGLKINTIGELAEKSLTFLVEKFGHTTGTWLHQVARGIDERPLVTEAGSKSMSRETTFARDLHVKRDRTELTEAFTALCIRVAEDLKQKGYAARTIGIKLRYQDFKTVTRDLTLPLFITEARDIRQAAGECLKRVSLSQSIRLLGVKASGLMPLTEINTKAYVQGKLPF